MTPRRGPTRHVFTEADPPDVDLRGTHWCRTCGLPESNAIHELPPVSEEQAAHEARRIGER